MFRVGGWVGGVEVGPAVTLTLVPNLWVRLHSLSWRPLLAPSAALPWQHYPLAALLGEMLAPAAALLGERGQLSSFPCGATHSCLVAARCSSSLLVPAVFLSSSGSDCPLCTQILWFESCFEHQLPWWPLSSHSLSASQLQHWDNNTHLHVYKNN